ncbi:MULTISPECIES: DoxX family protein [Pseudanabaena]|uniref:DoxX family protein n=2 Tax=Pseudanabaena TaxID=1152 RepID=L8MRP6_9CYAN|nr:MULTISPECIES: DoxX family protein [Pseudanabaena]ELS30587.1 DoxX family protein [Pseudanabaena biceps PCC 7429]MDG3497150.1 DoxX family protein [Pseudanabaena catenata USMAC16]
MNNTTRIVASIVRLLLGSDSAPVSLTQASLLLLRVVLGTVMIHNGFDKLADIPSFAEAYVQAIGLPFPIFFAYCAAFTEVIASPLLALGLFTRPAALGLFATMLVANYHHIVTGGFSIPSIELSSIYAVSFAFFVIYGGGKYAIDTLLANALTKWLNLPAGIAPSLSTKATTAK